MSLSQAKHFELACRTHPIDRLLQGEIKLNLDVFLQASVS